MIHCSVTAFSMMSLFEKACVIVELVCIFQHHEETQINIQGNLNDPFLSTGRYRVEFTPLHPMYRFELTIIGEYYYFHHTLYYPFNHEPRAKVGLLVQVTFQLVKYHFRINCLPLPCYCSHLLWQNQLHRFRSALSQVFINTSTLS